MRIGWLQITRLRRDPQGRKQHPWELVTKEQLTPEARQLIAKMARAAAKDYFEEKAEAARADVSATNPADSAVPAGMCMLCEGPGQKSQTFAEAPGGKWMHLRPQDCTRNILPKLMEQLDAYDAPEGTS